MTLNPHKQSQFEFFPSRNSNQNDNEGPKALYVFKDLTLSLENVIVLSIISLMTVVLFFAFGVERGKNLAKAAPGEVTVVNAANEEAFIIKVNDNQFSQKQTVSIEAIEQAPTVQEKREILRMPIEVQDIEEDNYTIQVASFKLEKNAKKEATRLEGIGYETFVMDKGNYSIVCVGKFVQRNEAKRVSRKLKNRYNDLLVRRL